MNECLVARGFNHSTMCLYELPRIQCTFAWRRAKRRMKTKKKTVQKCVPNDDRDGSLVYDRALRNPTDFEIVYIRINCFCVRVAFSFSQDFNAY